MAASRCSSGTVRLPNRLPWRTGLVRVGWGDCGGRREGCISFKITTVLSHTLSMYIRRIQWLKSNLFMLRTQYKWHSRLFPGPFRTQHRGKFAHWLIWYKFALNVVSRQSTWYQMEHFDESSYLEIRLLWKTLQCTESHTKEVSPFTEIQCPVQICTESLIHKASCCRHKVTVDFNIFTDNSKDKTARKLHGVLTDSFNVTDYCSQNVGLSGDY